MRDIPLLGAICATLLGIGLCILALFHIALYLVTLLIEWWVGRKKRRQPAPDFYQGLYESLIRHLERSEKR